MKLIQPDYEIVPQQPGLEGMYKQIEFCGRISHKSEDKITETSYKKFIDMMRKLQHFATFEHGTVYLSVTKNEIPEEYDFLVNKYKNNPYSKVHQYTVMKSNEIMVSTLTTAYITTNYRVICENGWESDLKFMVNEPTKYHEKRITVIFTCDIGVSREFNRHRVDSILEESTRYCNYAKNGESNLNVILPVWLKDRTEEIEDNLNRNNFNVYCNGFITGSQLNDIDYWLFANLCSEYCYTKLINEFKWTPQQARTILPLDTKTTLAHTAFESDWKHFFDLRALGTTGAPHPSAKQLAEPLMVEMNLRK